MKEIFSIYFNRAISSLLVITSLSYLTFLFLNNIQLQSENLNTYAKIMSLSLGIYAGLYCFDSVKGKGFSKQNCIVALTTIAIVLFGDINFEKDVFYTHGIFDFIRLAIGNILIILTMYLFFVKK